MLAQLAARLRARQGGAGDVGGEAVLVGDNCTVSWVLVASVDHMDTN